MPQTKEWTLMFYLASDNPLAPSIVPQLKSIKQAGFHQEVNVIAQFDPQQEGTPSHIFDVNLVNKLKGAKSDLVEELTGDRPNPLRKTQIGFSGFGVEDPFVSNLIEDKLWREQEDRVGIPIRERLSESLNTKHDIVYDPPKPPSFTKPASSCKDKTGLASTTGETQESDENRKVELNPRESLSAFINFCAEHYPARHYILFILGHGVVVANDIFLFDEHADEQSLSLTALGEVLTEFKEKLALYVPEGQLELVSFHSCSVSSLEVAYELQGTANYMLGSQGPAFVGSWPYRQILIRLFKDTDNLISLEQAERREEVRAKIDDMLRKIADYCFHNSKDFLMAGYSFDVTLCDLNGTSDYFSGALIGLSDVLRAGLGDSILNKFILLAHLEAQSEWQESYTDLHDFCFCLIRQCNEFKARWGQGTGTALGETLQKLDAIVAICETVRGLLAKGNGGGGVIIKSDFVGPEHQYSHGLSVYFPWSRPLADRQILKNYEEYKFNKATGWLDFLNDYFDLTQRKSRKAEINAANLLPRVQSPDEALTEDLANLVFNSDGIASSENALALPADKTNPNDRTGDACSCGSIKNYPRDTRDPKVKQQKAANPEDPTERGDVFVPLSQGKALTP